MSTLTEISEAMQRGRAKLIKTLVPQALEEGIPAQEILQDGLLAGMDVVGRKFKANEISSPICPRRALSQRARSFWAPSRATCTTSARIWCA